MCVAQASHSCKHFCFLFPQKSKLNTFLTEALQQALENLGSIPSIAFALLWFRAQHNVSVHLWAEYSSCVILYMIIKMCTNS